MPKGRGNHPSGIKTIALLGNPNCGKTSVFNQLTGLRQKTGNFPGVTIEKKSGTATLPNGEHVRIIDLPGTYSLYPTSLDERIVVQTFTDSSSENYPDAVLYIADATQLEKHLLLFTQIQSIGLPVLLGLNMSDLLGEDSHKPDLARLSSTLETEVVLFSSRTGEGTPQLCQALQHLLESDRQGASISSGNYRFSKKEQEIITALRPVEAQHNAYQLLLIAHHHEWLPQLTHDQRSRIRKVIADQKFKSLPFQVRETMQRYNRFLPVVQHLWPDHVATRQTDRLDRWLTHPIIGPVIFFLLMLLVFQAIYSWASYPMDWIDAGFSTLSKWGGALLPEGWFSSLITDGILAGLGGIVIFIPQIAILFFLIALLEEVGYMARAVYLFDNLMRRFGLNGRSIVALVSGSACAIPAIMSTRTIDNWKERLITIMVTPLVSCSARIPVYAVLVGFVVPPVIVWGVFNLQGLVFMGLYLVGIAAALLSAWVFHKVLKTEEQSYLLLELPVYRPPVPRNVWLHVLEKTKTFVIEAGKIIFVISIILWGLASFGPSGQMAAAEKKAITIAQANQLDAQQTKNLVASQRIEASYAGYLGKIIEPAIQPLGFDWKIGIALITSFAAREVFVGTMATIYSIGSDAEEGTVIDRLAAEKDPLTGEKVYNRATALSLLIFYVFAMQCMSTLAVVRRETNSWKWAIIQFLYMTTLAYLGSLFTYQLLV